jgi:hypothetical protein
VDKSGPDHQKSFRPQTNLASQVSSIVEDHVQLLAIGERGKRLLNAPDVLLLSLALPGENRNACGGDSSSGMVLSGENVARTDDQ